ncbi:MAG: hypothetical protein J4451_02100 [DPANN group archaeon]|nr:hypothetical protein [DPANN group archaeon]
MDDEVYDLQQRLEQTAKAMPEFMLTREAFKEWLEKRNSQTQKGSKLINFILSDEIISRLAHLELEYKSFTSNSTVAGYAYMHLVNKRELTSSRLNTSMRELQKDYTDYLKGIVF